MAATSPPSTALLLALKYYEAGVFDAAWENVERVLQEAAPSIEVLHLAAILRYMLGDPAGALRFCDQAGGAPVPDLDVLRGRALIDVGRVDEAVVVLRAAVKTMPQNAEALFGLGLAHQRAGMLLDAADAYRAATNLKAPFPDAWNNLGLVLEAQGNVAAATAAFETAIAQHPSFSSAHANLGALLIAQGHLGAAERACAAALQHDAGNVAAQINLGVALLEQGRHAAAHAALSQARSAAPDNQDAADNGLYLHHYFNEDPGAVLAAHRAWGGHAPVLEKPRSKSGRQRLRVGYVSPDFRRHSVSFFFEPLIAHHHKSKVEVFCYDNGIGADTVTGRLRGHADHWRQIVDRSDVDVARMIADDGIDILVDLAGHTRGNRLGVFALRAAPIQVSALGYPGTTGLPTMDFRLGDDITDPAGADGYATEEILRLPHGLHCYRPSDDAPHVLPPPAKRAGHITFGSFNKLGKLSDATVRLWSRVLKAVPTARLLIKSKALVDTHTQAFTAERFGAEGVSRERLMLVGWVPDDAGHLGAYGRVDVALDTFPYSGTTTTCEALWMGVPVMTLAGATHASRVTASLLHRVGLDDWATSSPDAFVQRAVRAAGDVRTLQTLRHTLRQRMAASPLCDGEAYAVAVEAAYVRLSAGR